MPVGRLIWRTPTGAVLWELWARQRRLFRLQAAVLCLVAVLAPWAETFSKGGRDLAGALAFQAGGMSLLQTLTCFCYMEVDARRLQGGIPGYLFLKPITTARLVLVPMIGGGLLVMTVFLLWVELVWRRLGFPMEYVWWSCLALFSFTCSVQGIGWSLIRLSWVGQAVLVILAGTANLLLVLVPKLPVELSTGWQLGIFAAMFASSMALALVGVQRVRRGAWEGGRAAAARKGVRAKKKPFHSAFRAQFWLEWKRQGLRLPVFTLIGLAFFVLVDFVFRFKFKAFVSEPGSPDDSSDTMLILNYLAMTPLVCSLVLGGALLAKFDVSLPGNEVPVFITIRPMTNADFVRAKVATAAVSSVLTWLAAGTLILLWLLISGNLEPARLWRAIQSRPLALAGLFASSFFLLVLLTWRNLVAGIGIGLAGRPGPTAGYNILKTIIYMAIITAGFNAREDLNFRARIFQWLPAFLIICLAVKVVFSVSAIRWALRRNAVTWKAIYWLCGAWLAGGLVTALISRSICIDLHAAKAWLWVVLAGFLLFPLADLALAPVSLTWNRHR